VAISDLATEAIENSQAPAGRAVCALIAAFAIAGAAFEKAAGRDTVSLSKADLRPVGDQMRHKVATGEIAGDGAKHGRRMHMPTGPISAGWKAIDCSCLPLPLVPA
jgi:hypothetical protein